MPVKHAAERGQTLPFWVMSILVALTLTFFLANYASTVKQQIHAQNAADSAASAALGKDAGALNSMQALLATYDIQEARTRDVAAAVPYILGTSPCGATNLLTSTCTSALTGAATDLATAASNLQAVATTINNFQVNTGGTLTGLLQNPSSTINTLFAPNGTNGCAVNVLTDCNYKYSTFIIYDPTSGMPTVDEYACKVEQNNASSFLHLNMKTFYSIGHATTTLAPVSAAYNPTTLGNGFLAASSVFPSVAGNALVGDLGGLNVNSQFYTAVGAPPPTASHSLAEVCP